jgi:hypothetical protein
MNVHMNQAISQIVAAVVTSVQKQAATSASSMAIKIDILQDLECVKLWYMVLRTQVGFLSLYVYV